ncbi:MAG TPA: DUF1501 domain-containing protein [Planctomycetota bacterium]
MSTPSNGASGSGLSRRALLGGSATLAATSLWPARTAAAARGPGRPVLVQVFLRGAMDGLTTVVPHGDGDLYAWRPTLAVQPPGPPQGARDLDGFFGLAPAAAPLLTPYAAGHLAIVHACGSTDPTRSHFDAFVRMEFGDPLLPLGTVDNGWITRTLQATQAQATSPLRAIGAGDILPHSLAGATSTLPVPDFASFLFPGKPQTAPQRAAAIAATYAPRPAPVGPAALDTLSSIGILAGIDFAGHAPANGAQYPASVLGRRLRDTAALIKAGTGVEVVTVDVDGWDLHAELGPITGNMALLLDDLSRALEAFYLDLLAHLDDYVLVCLSEFGRRVEENASAGTDHGHGNAMFVLGGGIHGGQVLAQWPGLSAADLDNGDLAITTDYRDVLGEVLRERLGVTDLTAIFPQHVFVPVGVA